MSKALVDSLHFVHGRVDLHLEQSHRQIALSNDQLARFCGLSQKSIRSRLARNPERFTEADTWLVTLDLNGFGVASCAAPNQQKKGRGQGAKTYRVWSFPEGCRKFVQWLEPTEQRVAFLDAISAYKDKQIEKALGDVAWEKSLNRQSERYWFGRRRWWPAARELLIINGLEPTVIAQRTGKSAASVRNAIHRMIDVGVLHPRLAAIAIEDTRFSRQLHKSGVIDRWEKPALQNLDMFEELDKEVGHG